MQSRRLETCGNIFRRMASTKRRDMKDAKAQVIHRILFENGPAPRIKFTEQEMLEHETIHRAWQLHQKQKRDRQQRDLERQYHKMNEACDELERLDKKLYQAAMVVPKDTLYPITMRIPTQVPPKVAWNNEWKKE